MIARLHPASGDLFLVIPVHNNADTIRQVVGESLHHVPDVIVVDDGSTDADIGALLSDLPVSVLRHPRNRGKGEALRSALSFLRDRGARTMITLDGDGQHDPADLPAIIAPAKLHPRDIIIGVRHMPHAPASSHVGRAFSDWWVRLETGLAITDTQSGFRAYPVGPVARLRLAASRYDFETELIVKAAWAGVGFHHVPITVEYSPQTRLTSGFRPLRDTLRFIRRHSLLVGPGILHRLGPARNVPLPEGSPVWDKTPGLR